MGDDDGLSVDHLLQRVPSAHSELKKYTQYPEHVLSALPPGEFDGNFWSADSGVGYVYARDAHPEQCAGFVDCS
jgi:hypothetical protein